jgi:hypothetical protein
MIAIAAAVSAVRLRDGFRDRHLRRICALVRGDVRQLAPTCRANGLRVAAHLKAKVQFYR